RQQKQKEGDRDIDTVVVRSVDGFFLTGQGFHQHREQRAPQNRKTAGQQNQIVEEKTRFPRNHAFQLHFASEVRQVLDNGKGRECHASDDKSGEVRLYRRLRESMNRGHQASAGQSRPQNAEQERG